jgi:hypothetical protein
MLRESNKDKLLELVLATEQAIVLRAQELSNSPDHHEGHSELAVAKAALLGVKVHKLGWPALPTPGDPMA